MAVTLTNNVLDDQQPGPLPEGVGEIREDIKITAPGGGVAAGDTGTYTCQFVRVPRKVLGPFAATFNGRVVTLTSLAAIPAAAIVRARVIGGA